MEKERLTKPSALVIVAHPDDEVLWAGGTILSHPACQWFIASLSRSSDVDRAPRFQQAIKYLKARGTIGDMDDGPEQRPLENVEVEKSILDLLPVKHFDIIISHHPGGEYTRHIRHEEIGKAVIRLWNSNQIATRQFWAFAYEDGHGKYLPRADKDASFCNLLTNQQWKRKYRVITEIYGFGEESWEARTTPRAEAFWQFTRPENALNWLNSINENQE